MFPAGSLLVDFVNMAKKILVTGAGGYIGRHVVSALLDAGQDVIASDLRLDGVDERATKVQQIFLSQMIIYLRS